MIGENLRIALAAIRANPLRSILTTLGIIIGVAAVIAVVSIVQGLSYVISSELEGVGATYLQVQARNPREEAAFAGRDITLTYEDGLAAMSQVAGLRYYDPVLFRTERVARKGEDLSVVLLGVGQHHQEVANHWVDRGRFFTDLDLDQRARVAVVGPTVVDDLGLGPRPVGGTVTVGSAAFTVVGVLEAQGELFGQDRDAMVLVPITTAGELYGRKALDRLRLDFQARSVELVPRARDELERLLRERHRLAEGMPDDFRVSLQEELRRTIGSILGTVTAVVAAVVGISLLVGGIGIMNIMLVSVTERTREIGIRKAVGARRQDILVQFLIEAVVLSLLGGVLGVGLGWGLGVVGARLIPGFPPAHVPMWAVALGFGFAAGVGLLFGTWPAAKASGLDPIEALHHE